MVAEAHAVGRPPRRTSLRNDMHELSRYLFLAGAVPFLVLGVWRT